MMGPLFLVGMIAMGVAMGLFMEWALGHSPARSPADLKARGSWAEGVSSDETQQGGK